MRKRVKNDSEHAGFCAELSVFLEKSLGQYIAELDGEPCHHLYNMTFETVEKELFKFVLYHHNGNVSSAAQVLGISRTTLSRKLVAYKLRR